MAFGFTMNVIATELDKLNKRETLYIHPETEAKGAFKDADYDFSSSENFVTESKRILKEMHCWNCRGFGHNRSQCPSTVNERSIASTMKACGIIFKVDNVKTPTQMPKHYCKDLQIPETIDAALNDMRFSSQWRAAMKLEYLKKSYAGFNNIFTTGIWSFQSNLVKSTNMIYFKAKCTMPPTAKRTMPKGSKNYSH